MLKWWKTVHFSSFAMLNYFHQAAYFDSPKSMTSVKTFFFYSRNDVHVSKSVFHQYKSGAIIKKIARSNSMMCNYVPMKQNYDSFCRAKELKVIVELSFNTKGSIMWVLPIMCSLQYIQKD